MVGVILCGGQSTRMGSDKGLLTTEGILWAQDAVNKLSSLQIPVSLSVNLQQYDSYAASFPGSSLITDNDSLQLKGPLLGVLSAHLQYPVQNLFVLACDMPLMETIMLSWLYDEYLQTDFYDAFIFTDNDEPEPLCGIYCAKGLAYIFTMYKDGSLKKHSMKFILENLNACFIPLTIDQKKYFKNVNTHTDLNGG